MDVVRLIAIESLLIVDVCWQLVWARRRAQSTVEYGLTLLAVAAAGLALWLLLGPAIHQLGERLVTEVNSIK
jgi:hypothetical protein